MVTECHLCAFAHPSQEKARFSELLAYLVHAYLSRANAAVEQCPGGASVSNSWFSRSEAEGESGVRCSTAAFSLRVAEGERHG